MSAEPKLGQRRYVQHVLSPHFPAHVEAQPDDVLDVEEWDGSERRQVGEITHGELTRERER